MKLRERKSVLDEREMQEMYRIEHRGLWAMYTLLCAAIVVQLLLGADIVQMAGEAAVVGLTSIGMMIAYVRRGIWDSRPSVKDNAAYAAVSAAGVAAVMLGCGRQASAAALAGTAMFALCFALLMLLMRWVQRRQAAQSEEFEDE